jgi:hypothetical protein
LIISFSPEGKAYRLLAGAGEIYCSNMRSSSLQADFMTQRSCGALRLADQLPKKGPVMDHCLAQVFCARLPLRLAKRDFVGFSIILHNQRMVHGDISRTLFKVTYRIATRGHHITQQLVGFRYHNGGAVHKPRLDPAPRVFEACTIAGRERPDVETFDSFRALFEPGFRMPPVTAFLHGVGIFSATELAAQSFGPALSKREQRRDARNHNHDESDDCDYCCFAHNQPPINRILLSSLSCNNGILLCILGHVNWFFEEGEANGVEAGQIKNKKNIVRSGPKSGEQINA